MINFIPFVSYNPLLPLVARLSAYYSLLRERDMARSDEIPIRTIWVSLPLISLIALPSDMGKPSLESKVDH